MARDMSPAPAAPASVMATAAAAATGARDVCLEPRYVIFLIYFIIHILLTLLHQTQKAHESQCGPTTSNQQQQQGQEGSRRDTSRALGMFFLCFLFILLY